MNKVKCVLVGARNKVEQGWCQYKEAFNEDGDPTPSWSSDASSWCLLGAINSCADIIGLNGFGAGDAAISIVGEVIHGAGSYSGSNALTAWNDVRGRQQDEVLRVLDEAIQVAAGAE